MYSSRRFTQNNKYVFGNNHTSNSVLITYGLIQNIPLQIIYLLQYDEYTYLMHLKNLVENDIQEFQKHFY